MQSLMASAVARMVREKSKTFAALLVSTGLLAYGFIRNRSKGSAIRVQGSVDGGRGIVSSDEVSTDDRS